MSWADEKIANPMGYAYAVLFPRARDAIAAYVETTDREIELPENICSVAWRAAGRPMLWAVDDVTGLARLPVQLYGYRQEIKLHLEIDPLMTGWVGQPCCESTIISFGFKKTLSIGCGGAFLTNNQGLAQAMEPHQYLPGGLGDTELTVLIQMGLMQIHRQRAIGFERVAKWDAALGDLLPRIPMEQVMPWRVMRRVPGGKRDAAVKALRAERIPVGTNYPPLMGSNKWGSEVINFFPDCQEEEKAATLIYRTLGRD